MDDEVSNEEYAASYAEYAAEALTLLKTHFAGEMHKMNVDVCIQHFQSDLWASPFEGFQHEQDIGALEDLKRKLLALSDFKLSWAASDALLFGAFNFGRKAHQTTDWEEPKGSKILRDFEVGYAELSPIIDMVINQIEKDTEYTRNHAQKNHEAINAIRVCQSFWNRFKERPAPSKGLNLATPFGRFVQDYFELMGIDGSAASAFKAWKTQNERMQKS